MNEVSNQLAQAHALKEKQNARFTVQGIVTGLLSGLTFGLYSTVIAVAFLRHPLLGATGAFAAPFVASAINDSLAAIWLLIHNMIYGRTREIGRSLFTFPGLMVVLGALFGGPIANGAYLVGIEAAGAAAIPLSALCPMFGAIFALIFLKQKISARVALGMLICIIGAALISYQKPVDAPPNFTFGIICALVAAVGWGLEGVFSAFGMSMIDSNIAITIRQGVSGFVFIFVVLPLFGYTDLFFETIKNTEVMLIIAGAALFTAISFLTWYVSNSKAGVAIGMSLNITYVLWSIIFAVVFLKQNLTNMVILGACIITAGAVIVSINPLDFFKKKEEIA